MIPVADCGSGEAGLSVMEKGGRDVPGEMQIKQVPKHLVEHKYPFHSPSLLWVSVCCEITLRISSDTGEGLKKSVSEW